jgi:hypothetical protein
MDLADIVALNSGWPFICTLISYRPFVAMIAIYWKAQDMGQDPWQER